MLRKGIQARCDRCGENKFYPDVPIVSKETMIEADGWEERLGKTLCAECTKLFDEMSEKFFNEIWDK